VDRYIFIEFLLVGSGGFIGSGLRYITATSVQRYFPHVAFPFGTVTVNVIGCFLIGYIANALQARGIIDPAVQLFLIVGILGGFTTFSAFSYENVLLAQDAHAGMALLNAVISVVAGFGAAWLGLQVGKVI
jgi:CrcB protein